jgi:hypothetical protein
MIDSTWTFKEPILRQNSTPFHLKFKSLKCFVADPNTVNIPFCHIKPISRMHSSFNIGLIIKKAIYGPMDVLLSINYKFGTIYRVTKTRIFNYCEIFKNGSFISKNPLHLALYYVMKDSLPKFAFNGCPFPTGVNCDFV